MCEHVFKKKSKVFHLFKQLNTWTRWILSFFAISIQYEIYMIVHNEVLYIKIQTHFQQVQRPAQYK